MFKCFAGRNKDYPEVEAWSNLVCLALKVTRWSGVIEENEAIPGFVGWGRSPQRHKRPPVYFSNVCMNGLISYPGLPGMIEEASGVYLNKSQNPEPLVAHPVTYLWPRRP